MRKDGYQMGRMRRRNSEREERGRSNAEGDACITNEEGATWKGKMGSTKGGAKRGASTVRNSVRLARAGILIKMVLKKQSMEKRNIDVEVFFMRLQSLTDTKGTASYIVRV
jgi:hypothetical protein